VCVCVCVRACVRVTVGVGEKPQTDTALVDHLRVPMVLRVAQQPRQHFDTWYQKRKLINVFFFLIFFKAKSLFWESPRECAAARQTTFRKLLHVSNTLATR